MVKYSNILYILSLPRLFTAHLLLLVVNHNQVGSPTNTVLSAIMPVLHNSSGLEARKIVAGGVAKSPVREASSTGFLWQEQKEFPSHDFLSAVFFIAGRVFCMTIIML